LADLLEENSGRERFRRSGNRLSVRQCDKRKNGRAAVECRAYICRAYLYYIALRGISPTGIGGRGMSATGLSAATGFSAAIGFSAGLSFPLENQDGTSLSLANSGRSSSLLFAAGAPDPSRAGPTSAL
jgi:hypothetical protein